MIPARLTTNGISASVPFVCDLFKSPFNIGMGAVVTGSATYTVQHTFDDIFNITPASCTWFPHDDATFVNATTNVDGNIAFPCTAIRLNQTAGAGSVVLTVIQAGLVN